MIPRSLRIRLFIGAALWIVLALVLAGTAIVYIFASNVERNLTADLDASMRRLVAEIEPEQPLSTLTNPLSDPRLITPFSGLYWQIEDLTSGELTRSPSLRDVVLETAGVASGTTTTLVGPEKQQLVAVGREVKFMATRGDHRYRVTMAEDRSVLDHSIDRFRSDMAIALGVVGLALVAAAALQVHLGLIPLSRLHQDIEEVRRGTAERLGGAHPAEVLPLVAEVNALLEARDRTVDSARARAADLAHGLKTPLSVLAATADRVREKGDIPTANLLADLAAEMTDRIDYQLRLAQLRLRTDAHVLRASLNNALLRTVSVLKKTHQGRACSGTSTSMPTSPSTWTTTTSWSSSASCSRTRPSGPARRSRSPRPLPSTRPS